MLEMCKSANIAEDCPDIELKGKSLGVVEKFCYLGGIIGARGGVFDSIITRISSGLCILIDLVPLLASRGLPLGAKD